MARADNFAQPRSRSEIEQTALSWRIAFQCEDSWSPDIINILEHVVPELDEDFLLRVGSRSKMRDELGFTNFSPPEIWLREDIYDAALRGDGRSRFTAAHELGHFLLHTGVGKPRLAIVTAEIQSSRRISEAQANCFAAAFLMPAHIVRQFSSASELAQCCNVSGQAAQNRMDELGIKPKRELPPDIAKILEDMKRDRRR
jgi:hypothetical protein